MGLPVAFRTVPLILYTFFCIGPVDETLDLVGGIENPVFPSLGFFSVLIYDVFALAELLTTKARGKRQHINVKYVFITLSLSKIEISQKLSLHYLTIACRNSTDNIIPTVYLSNHTFQFSLLII